jgi:hypothetical protein
MIYFKEEILLKKVKFPLKRRIQMYVKDILALISLDTKVINIWIGNMNLNN